MCTVCTNNGRASVQQCVSVHIVHCTRGCASMHQCEQMCKSASVCHCWGATKKHSGVTPGSATHTVQLTLVCRCNSQSPGFSSSCRCHCSSTTVTKLPVTGNIKVAVDPPTTNESHLYVPTDMPHMYHQVITDVPPSRLFLAPLVCTCWWRHRVVCATEVRHRHCEASIPTS